MGVDEEGDDFDDELLEIAVKRKPVLRALASEPHHRRELQERLGLSKTTCHRIVRTFDEHGLLRRTDRGYELTRFGEIVAERVDRFDSTIRTAHRIEPLLRAFEAADLDVDVELFTDATVTKPEPGDPYPFVDRSMELFRQSDTIRVIDRNQFIPPLYVEEALEIAIDTGMRGEFVVPKSIALETITGLPDLQQEVANGDASGKWFVYEDVPFGMALYDDHLDLRAYDDETGRPLLLVDTDDPAALEWAEDVYERYRDRAEPAATFEEFPDWIPDTPLEAEH